MLLSLLFTNEDCLAAAAPACEQQPFGDRYWREFYPGSVAFNSGCETAYVDIHDEALCEQLLNLAYDNKFASGEQAAIALDSYLEQNRKNQPQIKRQAA